MRRGIAVDEDEAGDLVSAGRVLVGGAPAGVPARMVGAGEAITLVPEPPAFVSRAGAKLAAAIERFDLEVAGRRAVDVGSSTGGFTDCLLQHGARSVVAIDVGYGLLHESLVSDERVRLLERVNVRDLAPARMAEDERIALVGEPADLVVVDVSFISLRSTAEALVALAVDGGDLVVLVKPQFEATRREADRGSGVITSPEVWARVLGEVVSAFVSQGTAIMGAMVSPVRGTAGNVEFALHLRRVDRSPVPESALDGPALSTLVEDVVAEAVGAS